MSNSKELKAAVSAVNQALGMEVEAKEKLELSGLGVKTAKRFFAVELVKHLETGLMPSAIVNIVLSETESTEDMVGWLRNELKNKSSLIRKTMEKHGYIFGVAKNKATKKPKKETKRPVVKKDKTPVATEADRAYTKKDLIEYLESVSGKTAKISMLATCLNCLGLTLDEVVEELLIK